MLINLTHLSKIKRGKEILKDISWQIQPGEKWLLYGLNGAGKSTLLNILNGYVFATSGTVELFQMEPGKVGYSADRVRQHIGFVSHQLMNRFQEGETVLDIVISGAYQSIGVFQTVTAEVEKQAYQLLSEVGMGAFSEAYYGTLSTGEQQRVLIARALMGQPSMLILDEPASGLDFIARETLLSALEQLYIQRPELSVIYVTHFVEELTPHMTHALLLRDGQCFKKREIRDVLNETVLSQFFHRPVHLKQHEDRYALFLQ